MLSNHIKCTDRQTNKKSKTKKLHLFVVILTMVMIQQLVINVCFEKEIPHRQSCCVCVKSRNNKLIDRKHAIVNTTQHTPSARKNLEYFCIKRIKNDSGNIVEFFGRNHMFCSELNMWQSNAIVMHWHDFFLKVCTRVDPVVMQKLGEGESFLIGVSYCSSSLSPPQV